MNNASHNQSATEAQIDGDEFQNLHEIIRKARATLDQNAWDYIIGGTETETTLRRNRTALDEIAFRPRVLQPAAPTNPPHVFSAFPLLEIAPYRY